MTEAEIMAHTLSLGGARAAPSVRPPDLAAIDDSDRRWKRLTEQADNAYAQGDLPLARATYEDALAEACRLFEAARETPGQLPVPVIYNVSCHNLAVLEERAERRDAAEVYFRRAYDRLVETANSLASPLPLRISCVQHLKHALAALVQHCQDSGRPDHIVSEVISRAHETAFRVFRFAQHAEIADASCPDCEIKPS